MKSKLFINIFALIIFFVGGMSNLFIYDYFQTDNLIVLKTKSIDGIGELNGNLNITQQGQANYSIDVFSSPGTNGVSPRMKLVYSSSTQNGILGVGWQLSGLSVISRTHQTIFQDGKRKGVSFKETDRFALNGQRLIAFKDNNGNFLDTRKKRNEAYGKDGTEYRTEIDSWTRVFSQGDCQGGPCSFKILNKDGSIAFLGETTNAKQSIASDKATILWGVNRIVDKNTNYVLVEYTKDQELGQLYPDAVRYTGNELQKITPQRSIKFQYEDRPDISAHYLNGYSFKRSKRIASITNYVDLDGNSNNIEVLHNHVEQLRINYIESISTGRSCISEINACDMKQNCLRPTRFKWTEGNSLHFENRLVKGPSDLSFFTDDTKAKYRLDVNGNGKLDLVVVDDDDNGDICLFILEPQDNGAFFSHKHVLPQGFQNYFAQLESQDIFVGDIYGNGKSALIAFGAGRSYAAILYLENDILKGTKIDFSTRDKSLFFSENEKILGDFNGDGISDFILFERESSELSIFLLNGENKPDYFSFIIAEDEAKIEEIYIEENFKVLTGDYNGDGLIDLSIFDPNSTELIILSSTGDGLFRFSSTTIGGLVNKDSKIYSGDFNGDGLTDLTFLNISFTSIPILYSKGNGNFELKYNESTELLLNQKAGFTLADFNGDGITDIAFVAEDEDELNILLSYSENDSRIKKHQISQKLSGIYSNQPFISDLNGDGLVEILSLDDDLNSEIPVIYCNTERVNTNSKFDLVHEISNGAGVVLDLEYLPATHDDVYVESKRKYEYPLMTKRNSLFVVSSLTKKVNDPECVTQLDWKYKYEGSVYDHNRGFLGYEKKRTDDLQNGTSILESYGYDFPLNGVIESSIIQDIDDHEIVLGESLHEYAYKEVRSTGVYRIISNSHVVKHYTESNYNFSTKKTYEYDIDYKSIIKVQDLGDIDNPDDAIYHHSLYDQYNENRDWWKAFTPIAEKTTINDMVVWDRWEEGNDLNYSKTSFDDRHNVNEHKSFINNFGNEKSGWSIHKYFHDDFGNIIKEIVSADTGEQVSKFEYDKTFHTFLIKTESPKTKNGTSLTSEFLYDPRFGIQVGEINPKKQTVFNIPDYGIDGFGRILETKGIHGTKNELVLTSISRQSIENGKSVEEQYIPTTWTADINFDKEGSYMYNKSYYDGFGRNVKTLTKTDEGKLIVNQHLYGRSGLIEKQYLPSFIDKRDKYTTVTSRYFENIYDKRGRIKINTSPKSDNTDGNISTKEIIRNEGDDRIVYTKHISPENQNKYVLYRQEYDSRGNLIKRSGPYDNSTKKKGTNYGESTFVYDKKGNVIKRTNPLNVSTSYIFNSANQLLSESSISFGTIKYIYNRLGQHIKTIKGEEELSIEYDLLGRVVSIKIDKERNYSFRYDSYPDGSSDIGRLTNSYIEKENGEIIESKEYRYDNRGNIISEITNNGKFGQEIVRAYMYDPLGRLVKSVFPDGQILKHDFTYGGHLKSIILNDKKLVSYKDYNEHGQARKIVYDNGIMSSVNYDLWGRMTNSDSKKANFNLYNANYIWSDANKLKAINDQRATEKVKEYSHNQMFKYSQAGRLIEASGGYGKEEYKYNSCGDRLSDTNQEFKYDNHNPHQVISIRNGNKLKMEYAYSEDGALAQKIVYDLENNKKVDFSFDFDINGSLTSVKADGENMASFSYDAAGQRIVKNIRDTTTYYFGPDFQVTQYGTNGPMTQLKTVYGNNGVVYTESSDISIESREKILGILDSSKNGDVGIRPFKNGIIYGFLLLIVIFIIYIAKKYSGDLSQFVPRFVSSRKKISWYASLFCAAMLVPSSGVYAEVSSKNLEPAPIMKKHFYINNQVGSASLITNEYGGVENQIHYKPFGEIDKNTSTGTNEFKYKFSGKELDAALGLHYFGLRYYDSAIGRFISPDPARQYDSPYVYADGDPLSKVDPDGAFAFTAALAIAAVVGAYVGASKMNGSYSPGDWNFSSKTWEGLVSGAATAAAIVATGGEALMALGVLEVGASSTATAIIDAAFLASDGYHFSQEPTAGNAAWLALDLVPFSGSLLGKSSHAGEVLETGVHDGAPNVEHSTSSMNFEHGAVASCPMSFAGGTEVLTREGTEIIEDLEVGDLVISWNEETQSVEEYAVTNLFRRVAEGLVVLTIGDSNPIYVTPEHPVYTSNHEWVEAQYLSDTSSIFKVHQSISENNADDYNYDFVPITHFNIILDTVVNVYNFEVEVAHTYFVGDGYLVHNSKGCSKRLEYMGATPGKSSKTGEEVFNRMKKQGLATGAFNRASAKVYLEKRNGSWYWVKLKNNPKVHMGHIIDAVTEWNSNLRFIPAKGKRWEQTREFMKDANNYEFEWGPLNSSNGAKLGEVYLPPVGTGYSKKRIKKYMSNYAKRRLRVRLQRNFYMPDQL